MGIPECLTSPSQIEKTAFLLSTLADLISFREFVTVSLISSRKLSLVRFHIGFSYSSISVTVNTVYN